jgi:enamine deaminase RidA (YjgF/YER057c/UK114 family)
MSAIHHKAIQLSPTERIAARLDALNIRLPTPPSPAGAYRAVVTRGLVGAVSGQFPIIDGRIAFTGRIGVELTEAQGLQAARLAALNALAQISAALGGFDRFAGLLRVDGYVASADDYLDQPRVLDAASNLLLDVLGSDLGAHTRTAFSVVRLPLGSCVELGLLFAVLDEPSGVRHPSQDDARTRA